MRPKWIWLVLLPVCFLWMTARPLSAQNAGAGPVNERVFEADYAAAWDALMEAAEGEGERFFSAEKTEGVIKTRFRKIELPEFKKMASLPGRGDAGGFRRPWLWARYRLEYKVNRVAEDQTRIKVSVRYEGWNASAGRYVRVISSGKREREFLDKLEAQFKIS